LIQIFFQHFNVRVDAGAAISNNAGLKEQVKERAIHAPVNEVLSADQ